MSRMHAGVVTAHGGPECLEYLEVDVPQPKRGWVRVQVLACALNMLDVFVRRGMPGVHLDLPHIPGGDVVGIVDALGEGVGDPRWGRWCWSTRMSTAGCWGSTFLVGWPSTRSSPPTTLSRLEAEPSEAPRYAALPIPHGTARRCSSAVPVCSGARPSSSSAPRAASGWRALSSAAPSAPGSWPARARPPGWPASNSSAPPKSSTPP